MCFAAYNTQTGSVMALCYIGRMYNVVINSAFLDACTNTAAACTVYMMQF
jgi:hypothetical protein